MTKRERLETELLGGKFELDCVLLSRVCFAWDSTEVS